MSHILVVDDHPENLYFLEALLSGVGHRVSSARHGAEALVVARREPPDLVISDLLMPVMDGYTLLRHWKADDRLKAAPFVVYTATYTETEDEQLALGLGADAFIVKPADIDEIIERVQQLLDEGHARVGPPREPVGSDAARLEEYSSVLIRKLEHKTLQLETLNQALRQEIAEREHAGKEKQRLTNDLRERVKELRLLNEAARLLSDDHAPYAEILEQLTAYLPGAFRFPELVAVRLRLADLEHCSPGFAETNWMLTHEFTDVDERRGSVEVAYLWPAPTGESDPFLPEEHNMVGSLIDMLRSYAERRTAQETRERLTEQLREERASLVFAQQVAKVGNWEADLRTLTITWSEQITRIYEIPPAISQAIPEEAYALVHPDDRAMVEAAFVQSLELAQPKRLDHRLLMPDGRVKYVTQHWHVRVNAKGRAVAITGTCQDVTDGVVAQREIIRQTGLLQAVADGTSDALFVKDTEGRYLLFNSAAAKSVGKAVEDVLGRDDREVFGPADAAHIMANDQWVMSTGELLTAEEVINFEDGVRTYLSTKAPYRDALGTVLGVIGSSRDVSERKAAEELLRANEARYRTTALQLENVLDNSLDLICSFDVKGRIVRMSAACEQILGYTPEELIGTRYLDFVVPEDHEKTRMATAEVVAGLPARNFENRYIRKDGSVRSIEWAAHWSLEAETMFCVGRDVTEHRLLQAQFLRAQRMESIGTLAGGIAHDFNNILAPIMLSIELLRMDVSEPVQLEVLSTIERSAHRGADMVQQLLSFARGVERDLVEHQLRHLIRDVEQILDDTFLKSIRVVTDVAGDLWPVMSDPTQLHQVLMNLAVNARDAMEGGGRLTIAADNVTMDAHEAMLRGGVVAGPYVRVRVSDTGSGMSSEVLDRVFEPFFTTKDIGKGTGLGLPTSQGIIRSHGGSMEVTSEVGHGTTVTFFLPASPDATVTPAPEAAPQLPRGDGQLVLLVDDEAELREVVRQTLEAFGYRVLLATDGQEATELYTRHGDEIAVVITDMMMPHVDGATTITRLRAIDPGVRVVVTSGVNTPDVVAEAIQLGAENWLSKPYTTESLLMALHGVLAVD